MTIDSLLNVLGLASMVCIFSLTAAFRVHFKSKAGWAVLVLAMLGWIGHQVADLVAGAEEAHIAWMWVDQLGYFAFLTGLVLHLQALGYSISKELRGWLYRTQRAARG